jgi:hypothetical protein
MPAKFVSGVSPRFHYRRHTFCFLPLATILESSPQISNIVFKNKWFYPYRLFSMDFPSLLSFKASKVLRAGNERQREGAWGTSAA